VTQGPPFPSGATRVLERTLLSDRECQCGCCECGRASKRSPMRLQRAAEYQAYCCERAAEMSGRVLVFDGKQHAR
jgi:hypothetical protein